MWGFVLVFLLIIYVDFFFCKNYGNFICFDKIWNYFLFRIVGNKNDREILNDMFIL